MRPPEEYYKEEFNPENWDIVSHLKDSNLFSFSSMMQFAEMYHRNEIKRINKAAIEDDEMLKNRPIHITEDGRWIGGNKDFYEK